MEEILNSILDISTIEDATIKIIQDKINLSKLISQLTNEMNLLAKEKEQQIIFTPSLSEVWINADEARIQDVLRNIISNAIKYSPIGNMIEINLSFNQKKARIQVIDEAGGIPESEQHLLFQPFAKISTQPTAGERSTGLGLAICKRIIELHKGEIYYQNNQNKGSIFEITLPIL